MARVEMIETYDVTVCTSNCTKEQCDAAHWNMDAPSWNRDKSWSHDDLEDAFATIRKVLPTMPKGAVIMLELEAMRKSEWDALPDIPVDEEGSQS